VLGIGPGHHALPLYAAAESVPRPSSKDNHFYSLSNTSRAAAITPLLSQHGPPSQPAVIGGVESSHTVGAVGALQQVIIALRAPSVTSAARSSAH
jgi:hypothetical protein